MDFILRLICFVVSISTGVAFRGRRFVPDDCGVEQPFTAPSGIIKSHAGIDQGHNYGKSMRCTWHIEAPVGWYVELSADTFELDASSSSCSYDYLALYDGPFLNSTYLGKFCGRTFLPISSTGRHLTLQFVTNQYNTYGGFKLYYNFTQTIIHSCHNGYFLCNNNYRCVQQSYRCDGDDDCGDDSDEQNCPPFTCSSSYFPCVHERRCISTSHICDGGNDCSDGSDEVHSICKGGAWKCGQLNYTGASGTLQSPNYPSSYPTSMACRFEIFAPNGTQNVTIQFSSTFSIEADVGCAYDYLKIYSASSGNMHGPYCGTKPPPNLNIAGDHVIVEFNSDGSDSYYGFQLHWSAS